MLPSTSTLLQSSETYLVRWPGWVGGIIALAMIATLWGAVSETLRRHFGSRTMWVVAGSACVLLGIFLAIEVYRAAPSAERPGALLSSVITVIAMFLAPTYGVWVGSRTQSATYLFQIGRGVVAAFGFATLALVGAIALSLVISLLV